jgi:hypothetical protein
MKDLNASEPIADNFEDSMSARFAHLVVQQSSMAMMLLGKAPHPETGQVMRDLDAARFFIDQLEMLEQKTKGNLTPEETTLLKQSLMSLRMAFVECANSAEPAAQPGAPAAGPAAEAKSPPPAAAPAPAPGEPESHKKFTKKY